MNQELISKLNDLDLILDINDEHIRIKGDDNIVAKLEEIYNLENEYKDETIMVDLKGLPIDIISEAIKYSLTREDLRDSLMILNIFNLVKIYNTLDESFFEDKNVYVSSIENMLDIKLSLRNEIKAFSKKLSIYFISLFKSYNKLSFNPLDTHIELPNIYSTIILSSDILTLSGIFSTSEPFSTSECVYIDNSFKYISSLLTKNFMTINFMDDFFKGLNDGTSN